MRTRRTSSRTERGQGGQRRTISLYKGDSNAASQYASDGAKVNISKKKVHKGKEEDKEDAKRTRGGQ